MPMIIAALTDVGVFSGMPASPITPKLTITVASSGRLRYRPASHDRNTSAQAMNTTTIICAMLSSLPRTSVSLSAADCGTLPPMDSVMPGGSCGSTKPRMADTS